MIALKINDSTNLSDEHLDELRNRVWEWCFRNLKWMTRHNATLGKKLYFLHYAKATSIERLQHNEILAVHDDQVGHDCMLASALTLGPQLETLLANYGAKFVDLPDTAALLKKAKISVKAAREVLPFDPTNPGEPFRPPRVVWTFHVGDWPTTSNVKQLFPLDPGTEKMAAWAYLGQPSLPDVLAAIPETELAVDYVPIMRHAMGIAWDTFSTFSYLMSWGDTIQMGVHSNASLKEITTLFEDVGVLVINAKESLKIQQAMSQLDDRITSTYAKNVYDSILETWLDEAALPREERASLFVDLCLPKLSIKTIEDRLGILVNKIESMDGDPTELYAEIFLQQDNHWQIESPIWWNLAARLQNDKKLQSRLIELGFDEGALRIFERRFHFVAVHRSIKPKLDVPVAPLPLPKSVSKKVATYLRKTFPILTDDFVIRLEQVFELDNGELHATIETLFQNKVIDNPRTTFRRGDGPSTKTGPLLRHSERGNVAIIKSAVQRLLKLSTDEILQTPDGEFLLRPLVPATGSEYDFLSSFFPIEDKFNADDRLGTLIVTAEILTDGQVAYIAIRSSSENLYTDDPECIVVENTIELGSFEVLMDLNHQALSFLIRGKIDQNFGHQLLRYWIHRVNGTQITGKELRILASLGLLSGHRWRAENGQIGRINEGAIVDELGVTLDWDNEQVQMADLLSPQPGYSVEDENTATSVNPIYTGGAPQTPESTQLAIIQARGWSRMDGTYTFVLAFDKQELVSRLEYDDDHGLFTASFHRTDGSILGGESILLCEVPARLYAEVVQVLVDAHPFDDHDSLLKFPYYN